MCDAEHNHESRPTLFRGLLHFRCHCSSHYFWVGTTLAISCHIVETVLGTRLRWSGGRARSNDFVIFICSELFPIR
ncbi:hypothetical protein Y048_5987 [Burkholderia pseudomallei MSHR456]|nr:hypothetical protein Y048_5987 [Burkholderia pseudomallei MSHR456]